LLTPSTQVPLPAWDTHCENAYDAALLSVRMTALMGALGGIGGSSFLRHVTCATGSAHAQPLMPAREGVACAQPSAMTQINCRHASVAEHGDTRRGRGVIERE
jgi:hypothetical protein